MSPSSPWDTVRIARHPGRPRPAEYIAQLVEGFVELRGDRAVVDRGSYRILGRESVDILKSGGEKISALEIEEVLRTHPTVADVAVVGVPDPEWGDRVCAAVVATPGQQANPEEIRTFAKSRLAPYKVPKEVLVVDDLPRNAMGKVMKPAVKELF